MDAIISTIITPVVDTVLKPPIKELGYLFNLGANITKLKKISRELNQKKQEVHEEIARSKAESDEMTPSKQVMEWMTEVQTLKHDVIAKIDEDYDHQKAHLPINFLSRYRISKRAANAVLESEELMRKRQRFEGVAVRSAPTIRRIPTPLEVTPSSTEMYLKEAIDYIQDDNVGMVGIWGMGGVGKTTLLQKINNHPLVADARFDYVIWLTASQDLNLDRLKKEIADRVGFKHEDAEIQAQALYHYLEMKRFLLLLDDIWEPFDLTKAGIPHLRPCDGAINKHKVVFTTRSESVSDQMMAYQQLGPVRCKKIKIECLRREEAWELFLSNVGEGMRSVINSDQRVGKRAKKVADKCGGLPLALVVIARSMSANTTWQEWEEAVNLISTNRIQEMWNKGDDPFPLLKISYDRLRDDVTRKCFLCCALWPEDREIAVPELIDCWLGLGIIDYHGDIGATYRRGHTIVERLKRACLLERADDWFEDKVKMHDIIRGMSLWIVSASQWKWMVDNRANLKDGSEDATQWREAETISLSYGRKGILPQRPDCPKLSSLMLSRNGIGVIPEGFFQNMPALTFLDLSGCGIEEVPPAIGGLLQLQHLDLSDNPIRSMPLELENLGGLKVLLLNGLHGGLVYPKLSKFQKLGHLGVQKLMSYKSVKEEQDLIEEVAQSKVTSLDITVQRLEIVEQLVAKNPPVSFRKLQIRRLEGVTTLQLPLPLLRIGKTSSTLSEMRIWSCDELEDIWISNQCEEEFDNLERFRLWNLRALRKVSTLSGSMSGSLPLRNVRFMTIQWCGRLKSATWMLQHCLYIESLEIGGCKEMEHVIGNDEDGSTGDDDGGDEEIKPEDEGGGAAAAEEQSEGKKMEEQQEGNPMVLFPHLRFLAVDSLPKLRAFYAATGAVAFPSLKIVEIRECPLLDEAPFSHLKIHRDIYELIGTGGPP